MRLKELRKKRKLTQSDLAEATGISNNNISRYERGIREPDIETLVKLAKYFNVSIDYILNNDTIEIINTDGLTKRQKEIINDLLFEFKEKTP